MLESAGVWWCLVRSAVVDCQISTDTGSGRAQAGTKSVLVWRTKSLGLSDCGTVGHLHCIKRRRETNIDQFWLWLVRSGQVRLFVLGPLRSLHSDLLVLVVMVKTLHHILILCSKCYWSPTK